MFAAHDIGYFFYTVGAIVKIQLLKFLKWLKNLSFLFNVLAFLKLSITTYLILTVRLVLVPVGKYVATSTLEAGLDVKSMAETSTKVFILEVMGRHAGWIAAASCLAASNQGDPPHIILLPEVPFEKS